MEKDRVAGLAFGTLLRRHRLAAGLSQEVLAERARMSVNGIGALERGDRQYPYRETVTLLARALSLVPAAEAELEAAAVRPRQQRALTPADAAAADGRDLATNLPSQRTILVGREIEIADIVGILQNSRLVTVTGAGGVGKTRTALAVGDALVKDTRAGVWLVELAPVQGSFVPAAVARALNVQESPNRPLLETLLAYLKQKSLLLILDNCEHVIAEAAALADALLRGCPQLRVLATSREPLQILGERTYRLPSLNVPTTAEIVGLSASAAAGFDAVVLFAQRAQAIDCRFALNDDNAPIVADVCRRLDGIPLAIELAAPRVAILRPRELQTRLDERFRVLTGGSRDALPRQQTLRALIDWSYDLLDERERRLFRRLGIFITGFTLDGAIAVGSDESIDEFDVFDLLASLVNKSLVVAELTPESTRYRLLESTRAYANEKLEDASEREQLAERHLRYLHNLFQRVGAAFEARPCLADVLVLAIELDDARAALAWAATNGRVELGAELLIATPLWPRLGLACEALANAERYVRLVEGADVLLRARVWQYLAHIAFNYLQRLARAADAASKALALARASNDRQMVAKALLACALAWTWLHRLPEGEAALDEAEAAAPLTEFDRGMATFCREELAEQKGDFETAARLLEQMSSMHRSLGNDGGAFDLLNLAVFAYNRGETRQAIAYTRDALGPGRRPDLYRPFLLTNLTEYLLAVDALDDAREAGHAALEFLRETDPDGTFTARVVEHMALAAALGGDARCAARLEGYADARLRAEGHFRGSCPAATHERLRDILNARIAACELDTLLAEGAAWTSDDAITQALRIANAEVTPNATVNAPSQQSH